MLIYLNYLIIEFFRGPGAFRVLIYVTLFNGVNVNAQNFPMYNVHVADSSWTGYYFLTPVKVNGGPSFQPQQWILDQWGRVIYYRPLAQVSQENDFKLQKNGQVTFFKSGQYLMLDSLFDLRDSVSCINGIVTDSHDMQILANGNFLVLGSEVLTMDLSMYNFFGPQRNNPGSVNAQVKAGVIQEFDSNKNLIFQWRAKDHFNFDDVDPYWLGNPNNVDWTHCNSVEMAQDGNLLLSSRHFNEITKIDHSNGSIIWRFGGKRNQFTLINDTIPFYGQHDARSVANGILSLFDNGYHILPHAAQALQYHLDEQALTARLDQAYIHQPDILSRATGNFQVLKQGRSLVNFGYHQSSATCFQVIDSTGYVLFELGFPDTLMTYRAFRYDTSELKLPRPELYCEDSAGISYLKVRGSHTAFRWQNGSVSDKIPLQGPGSYYAFLPFGNQGGWLCSEIIQIDDPLLFCGVNTGTNALNSSSGFRIYPNPANEKIKISEIGNNVQSTGITLFDIKGKKILDYSSLNEKQEQINIDISFLPDGMYFIQFGTRFERFVKMSY